jgi:hypothetical protein
MAEENTRDELKESGKPFFSGDRILYGTPSVGRVQNLPGSLLGGKPNRSAINFVDTFPTFRELPARRQ